VAQCHQGTFFEDVSHLADGPVAQKNLDGTYDYPPDLDPATRLLFEEALATYAALSPAKIATNITPEDFQHFWRAAREWTSLSYNRLPFVHYIAASYCPDLSLLHAAKLSICTRNRVPLAWWGKGLTVLLENIMGNVFVHKLWAICLLEADFNWWNKLIFAKRMMQQAVRDGLLPQEVFAKKHSHCHHAVLTKQFFCNSSHTLHHPKGLGECNFGDCYDRAAHPPTSIALQSWGIPKSAIRVLLSSIQTMQYVLKTGFGKSEESYSGTESSPNSGLGQGSGASPPAFTALSSLIINSYCQMGHSTKMRSSYFGCLFYLALWCMWMTPICYIGLCPLTRILRSLLNGCNGQQWTMVTWHRQQVVFSRKRSVPFIFWTSFVCGHAKMKSLHNLPPPWVYVMDKGCIYPLHISIPQPDGLDAPIETQNATTASKMLGVHFSPVGKFSMHVEHMVQKGMD
jgi:hypothetical protein